MYTINIGYASFFLSGEWYQKMLRDIAYQRNFDFPGLEMPFLVLKEKCIFIETSDDRLKRKIIKLLENGVVGKSRSRITVYI